MLSSLESSLRGGSYLFILVRIGGRGSQSRGEVRERERERERERRKEREKKVRQSDIYGAGLSFLCANVLYIVLMDDQ